MEECEELLAEVQGAWGLVVLHALQELEEVEDLQADAAEGNRDHEGRRRPSGQTHGRVQGARA